MAAYYNENNPAVAAWLRQLVMDGLIPNGDVDDRDIRDVRAADLRGYRQVHMFAGVGGWPAAFRRAGWGDERPVWSGSCPCQRFSSASRGRAVADDLWPEFRRLIADCRPRQIFGEQVATARRWFDGVCDDLEALDYTVGAQVLPACSVGADHARPRLFFVGHTDRHGESGGAVDAEVDRLPWDRRDAGRLVPAHGISRDMVALAGFGNAVHVGVAAEVIRAYMDLERAA